MQKTENSVAVKVLAIAFLLITIFSVLYTSAEAGHKLACHEDNCPICFVITTVKENLKLLSLGLAGMAICIASFGSTSKISIKYNNLKTLYTNSLIIQKIRLND